MSDVDVTGRPGGVPRVLCQPGGAKSCGACCGMYNHRVWEEGALIERVARRTAAYRAECDVSDVASLRAFRAQWEDPPESKLLGELPSCPFLGFLDDDPEGRVGCLVHPLQNDGVDGRDCGVYDRETCEGYLCAAHSVMSHDEKWLVLTATRDSYVYGLTITDVRFVRELFELAARRNGALPRGNALASDAALEAAAAYFELKRAWPWRPADGIFGQVIPGVGLETRRRAGPAEQVGEEPDEFEAILLCLGTEVDSVEELERARASVRARVERFAQAVS